MQHTPISKIKLFLGISIAMNVSLVAYVVLGFFAVSQISDFAQYNAIQNKLCEQDYQKILDGYDRQFPNDPQKANAGKMSFALNACLRNYKTGQRLNLQPLIDQVK